MVIKSDMQNPGNGRIKLPLFQEWIRENPLFFRHIPQKDWFLFLQQVIKSLKISDFREVFQFLNAHVPILIKQKVPLDTVTEGITQLRSLVFHHIVNDHTIPFRNKEILITQLLSLFDNIFRQVRERYTSLVTPESKSKKHLQQKQLNQINNMAFYVEQDRFGNEGYLNTAFREWTGMEGKEFWAGSGWEWLIHPEDFRQILLKLNQLIGNRFPIYELTYRMKHHNDSWLHVIELGRIKYNKSGEIEVVAGIIFEASTVFQDRILNSEAAKILHSILDEQDEPLAEQLKLLNAISRQINQLTDPDDFYQKVTDLARKLIPAARESALLLKSPAGFVCTAGNGVDMKMVKGDVILSQSAFELYVQAESSSGAAGSPLVHSSAIKNEILQNLFFTPPYPLELNIQAFDIDQLLCGLITANNAPQALLVINISSGGEFFSSVDQHLFEQFVQTVSTVLNNIILSRRFRENHSDYQTLFENSPLPVFILQGEKLKAFNKKFQELIGLAPEILPEAVIWNYVDPEDAPGLQNKLAALNEEGSFIEHEFRLIGGTGKEIHCQGAFARVTYRQKPAIVCELTDITRLRNLENQLLQTQKMETLGNLTAGIAHDFNNILGTIIPSAQMIMKHSAQPENQQRAKIIFQMAQRAASLTRQLLSYSQLREEHTETFNLNDIILDAQDMLQKMAGPFIRIEYSLAGDLPDISGESNQVLQILVNLVLNASEAMPEGGNIHIATQQRTIPEGAESYKSIKPGAYALLSVKDSGTGIPKEIRSKIFKPFFTTKAASGGSGLGLSVVYGILRKHKGYVTLQSVEGQGSLFKIYLPVSVKVEEEKTAAVFPPAQQDLTILIVDDEKYMREVLMSMAKVLGYQSLEAPGGKEAIRLYQAHRDKIDLVILDYAMPDLSGKDTYFILKKMNPDLRVILATGYGEKKGIDELTRERRIHFLPKPFTLEMLGQKIRSVLEAVEG